MLKIKTHSDDKTENFFKARAIIPYRDLSVLGESPDETLAGKIETEENWFLQKQSRLSALYNTTRYIWKYQGFLTVLRRTLRFIKGERVNSKIELFKTAFPSPDDSKSTKNYRRWISRNEPDSLTLEIQLKQEKRFKYRPPITLIADIQDIQEDTFRKLVENVLAQTYTNWEILFVGLPQNPKLQAVLSYVSGETRIKFITDSAKSGESRLNSALKLAGGEFVMKLCAKDKLPANALYEYVSLLNNQTDADIIYADEDKINDRNIRYEPFFKPDWSPDLFYSTMYICRSILLRKSLIEEIGGFRENFGDAADFDLILRLTEKTDRICHIPKILCHARQNKDEKTVSDKKQYARVVSEHLRRLGVKGSVSFGESDNVLRVKRKIENTPKVSIIIPTYDKVDLLKNCLESIRKISTYSNYEILIVDNNSSEKETGDYLKQISGRDVRVLEYNHPFNFSAINNFAAGFAEGELLLFLNNDTEVISPEWLEAMVEHAMRPEVGAVGARLLYPDGSVQHAGVILGIGGIAGHSHKHLPQDHSGYFNRAKAVQNTSAVTGACMMMKAETFRDFGGFDEKNVAIAFNDIDLCLRLREKQLLIVYTPYAELMHYESVSRGLDLSEEKSLRLKNETNYMLQKWKPLLLNDPYYNPNLSLKKEDFSIAVNNAYTATSK